MTATLVPILDTTDYWQWDGYTLQEERNEEKWPSSGLELIPAFIYGKWWKEWTSVSTPAFTEEMFWI